MIHYTVCSCSWVTSTHVSSYYWHLLMLHLAWTIYPFLDVKDFALRGLSDIQVDVLFYVVFLLDHVCTVYSIMRFLSAKLNSFHVLFCHYICHFF